MMSETQQSIGQWAEETFPGGDVLAPTHALRLLEEVVELCAAVGASQTDILASAAKAAKKTDGPKPDKVAEEMADCMVVLCVCAHKRGVDLQAETDAKMEKNRKRLWKSNGDGTGQHTREVTEDDVPDVLVARGIGYAVKSEQPPTEPAQEKSEEPIQETVTSIESPSEPKVQP